MKPVMKKEVWDDWSKGVATRDFSEYTLYIDPLLREHLDPGSGKTVLEVGCVPGRNLVYFARRFGFEVHGVDFAEGVDDVPELLRRHGIEKFEITRADFFSWRPGRRYDVVLSSGFVEHFEDAAGVFDRHVALLAKDGLLVITLPNMRWGQYALRLLLGGRAEFSRHVLKVMRPGLWKDLARTRGLEVLYCDYYKTFGFWLPPEAPSLLRLIVRALTRATVVTLERLGLNDIPNAVLSPTIVLIARRPLEGTPWAERAS